MLSSNECKAARSGLGLTQTELGDAAGVSKRTILDFENGTRMPIRATLQALKLALEKSGAEFVDGKVCVPVEGDVSTSGQI